MLFGKLISLILVSAILNPICCCNAERLVAEAEPIAPQHSCCEAEAAGHDAPESPEAPCEGEEQCSLKPDAQSHGSQVTQGHGQHHQSPAFPWMPWAHTEFAFGAEARSLPDWLAYPRSDYDAGSTGSLRLHQSYCLYLI